MIKLNSSTYQTEGREAYMADFDRLALSNLQQSLLLHREELAKSQSGPAVKIYWRAYLDSLDHDLRSAQGKLELALLVQEDLVELEIYLIQKGVRFEGGDDFGKGDR